jgi:hypothetical protein
LAIPNRASAARVVWSQRRMVQASGVGRGVGELSAVALIVHRGLDVHCSGVVRLPHSSGDLHRATVERPVGIPVFMPRVCPRGRDPQFAESSPRTPMSLVCNIGRARTRMLSPGCWPMIPRHTPTPPGPPAPPSEVSSVAGALHGQPARRNEQRITDFMSRIPQVQGV